MTSRFGVQICIELSLASNVWVVQVYIVLLASFNNLINNNLILLLRRLTDNLIKCALQYE